LIKLDIINEVVNRTGITKTKAEMAVETVFESMKRALEQGDRIELRGFGVFNVKPRKTGIGRNPRTGAEVSIPPGKAVRFKPGKELQTLQCSPWRRMASRPRLGKEWRVRGRENERRVPPGGG
jgi:DNA-binding protein HU-beta